MPFPLTVTGRLALLRPPDLADLASRLKAAGAIDIRTKQDVLTFRVPWSVSQGLLLGVARGSVALALTAPGAIVEYRLSLARPALTNGALIYLFMLGIAGVSSAAPSLLFRLAFATAAWGASCAYFYWRAAKAMDRLLADDVASERAPTV